MKFCKMNGIGNDYIFIDLREEKVEEPQKLAKMLSDRHFSVGGDGLVLIGRSEVADADMRIFNADGSEANMCGNAIRCVAKYIFEKGYTQSTNLTISTLSGIKKVNLSVVDKKVDKISVNMGSPRLIRLEGKQRVDYPIKTKYGPQLITPVDVGNYHAVYFTNDLSNDAMILAKEISSHLDFSHIDGINCEIVKILDRHNIAMRVWERGAGETLACGTGASAAAFAAFIKGLVDSTVTVHLKGGKLSIAYMGGKLWMEGDADYNFEGVVNIDNLKN